MNRQERRAAAHKGDVDAFLAQVFVLEGKGRVDDVVRKFRQAVSANASNSTLRNNFGAFLIRHGRKIEAIAEFKRALALDPANVTARENLGNLSLERGDYAAALGFYNAALESRPETPELLNNKGISLAQLGRFDEAVDALSRVVSKAPSFVSARINLAKSLLECGRIEEALQQAETASRSSEQNDFPHFDFGTLMLRAGCLEPARHCFEAYLKRDPHDALGARALLAAAGGADLPSSASFAHMNVLYAGRASFWDEGAQGATGYQGGRLVAQALLEFLPSREIPTIVDLGCGTGLVGELVRQRTRRLVGVDLSPEMLARAREKKIYDKLYQMDLISYLREHPNTADAIACAATLIHFGALDEVLAASAGTLLPAGVMAVTVFPHDRDPEGYAIATLDGLGEGGCFAHGERYVGNIARIAGLELVRMERVVHEFYQGRPRMALLVILKKQS